MAMPYLLARGKLCGLLHPAIPSRATTGIRESDRDTNLPWILRQIVELRSASVSASEVILRCKTASLSTGSLPGNQGGCTKHSTTMGIAKIAMQAVEWT